MSVNKLLLWLRDFLIVGFVLVLVMGAPYVFFGESAKIQVFGNAMELWIKNNYWNFLGLIGFAFAFVAIAIRED